MPSPDAGLNCSAYGPGALAGRLHERVAVLEDDVFDVTA